MKKLIDLSDNCVEVITIEAVKKKTKFKLYVQDLLENHSTEIKKRAKKNNK